MYCAIWVVCLSTESLSAVQKDLTLKLVYVAPHQNLVKNVILFNTSWDFLSVKNWIPSVLLVTHMSDINTTHLYCNGEMHLLNCYCWKKQTFSLAFPPPLLRIFVCFFILFQKLHIIFSFFDAELQHFLKPDTRLCDHIIRKKNQESATYWWLKYCNHNWFWLFV